MRVVDGVKTVCLLDRREYVTLFGMTFVVHPLSLSLAFFCTALLPLRLHLNSKDSPPLHTQEERPCVVLIKPRTNHRPIYYDASNEHRAYVWVRRRRRDEGSRARFPFVVVVVIVESCVFGEIRTHESFPFRRRVDAIGDEGEIGKAKKIQERVGDAIVEREEESRGKGEAL